MQNIEAQSKTPKISVIVPVYKVEKYLPECIESVLAQTFTDFELILVDDGSPDNSGKICDDYAKKDSRIRVFHKENGGVTSARRLGVERSCGEWIMFVDGDDVIPLDALGALWDSVDGNVDLVEGAICDYFCRQHACSDKSEIVVDRFHYVEGVVFRKWLSGPVAKIFRRSLLTPYAMSVPGRFHVGEDFLMLLRAGILGFRYAKKISRAVYFYRRVRENSATNKFQITEVYARDIYAEKCATICLYDFLPQQEQLLKAGAALVCLRRFISEGTCFDRDFWLGETRAFSIVRDISPANLTQFFIPWVIRCFVFFHAERILTLGNRINIARKQGRLRI